MVNVRGFGRRFDQLGCQQCAETSEVSQLSLIVQKYAIICGISQQRDCPLTSEESSMGTLRFHRIYNDFI